MLRHVHRVAVFQVLTRPKRVESVVPSFFRKGRIARSRQDFCVTFCGAGYRWANICSSCS